MTQIDEILEGLLLATGASRVTLRRDLPGDYAFPVTHEALREGVGSLREERTVDLRGQPVPRLLAQGQQVVQHDTRSAFEDDPEYQRMLEVYGGLAAQVVTPIFRDGALAAALSLHQLGEARRWTDAEIAACTLAAEQIQALL